MRRANSYFWKISSTSALERKKRRKVNLNALILTKKSLRYRNVTYPCGNGIACSRHDNVGSQSLKAYLKEINLLTEFNTTKPVSYCNKTGYTNSIKDDVMKN